MKKLLFFGFICFLSGCSSLGGSKGASYSGLKEFKKNTGQVYIYRPSSFAMGFAIPTTKIDDIKAEGVRNGSYMIYELSTGTHTISLSNNGNWAAGNIEFEVDVKAERRYFYRLTPHVGDMAAFGQFVTVSMGSYLNQVEEQFAVDEMSMLKFTNVWP